MQICIPSAMLCSLHIWTYKFLHKFYLNLLFLFAIDIRLFTHFPHQSRQIFKLHCPVDGLEYTCINTVQWTQHRHHDFLQENYCGCLVYMRHIVHTAEYRDISPPQFHFCPCCSHCQRANLPLGKFITI